MVRSASVCLLVSILIFACSEDFERQLYDYQVERLLAGGSQAVWHPTSIIQNGDQLLGECEDSVLFMFALNTDDSISFQRLRPICQGGTLYDTLEVVKGNASFDGEIFTDSIRFSTGEYFLIQSIFSRSLVLQSGDTLFSFRQNSDQ